MGFNDEPKREPLGDWPEIVLADDPAIRERLTKKLEEYDRRIHAGTHLRVIGHILHRDFHEREQHGLIRTDAYLKMIYASVVLQEGRCDTGWLHDQFRNHLDWATEFNTIQYYDPHKFDELSWNAAEVIREYATGIVEPVEHSQEV